MADVIAGGLLPGAGTQLPQGYQLMPVQFVMGLPWYYWAFVGVGFIMMMMLIGIAYYWKTMMPVRAYFGAAFRNEDLLVFLRKSGKMSFRNSRYLTGIFNDKEFPLSWIQRSSDSFRLGSCMTKIVCDTTGIATEPTLNQAIKTWVVEWNDKEMRAQAESFANDDDPVYEPRLITDYYDLYQAVKDGWVDDPVVIPAVFEVPIWELERYLAHVGSGDLEGHVATRIEEDKIAEEKKDKMFPGWLWIFIAVEVCVLAPVVIIMLMNK